jgi:aarF domain-containing kinase
MNTKLSELIAALPEASADSEMGGVPSQEQLDAIFADLALKPVPVRSLHRLWTTGELSVQIALGYFALWMRGWFSSADARKRHHMETNLRLALETFHRLSYLRGAMTKLGQAAASLPVIFPKDIIETLDRLHFDVPPMHFSLLREMVGNELGKEPDEVFATFEKRPFAAASLGQVHLAVLKTGERVVVKIQYPGIARTIDADFRNLSALLFPMRLGRDWAAIQAQFEAIRRMLKQEIDYVQEAESTRRARDLFRPEDGIVVPEVYSKYSTQRLLTTEYIPGLHLQQFLAAKPSQAMRNGFGTKMFVASFRMCYADMNYADPHSGNYLFMNDGRLGLIDFGCIQHYNAEERRLLRFGERIVDGDPGAVRELAKAAFGLNDREIETTEYLALTEESCKWMMEPLQHNGPFDFGDEAHLKRGIDFVARTIRKGFMRSHPVWVYHNRSVFGLKALLFRLGAQVDANAVISAERDRAGLGPGSPKIYS